MAADEGLQYPMTTESDKGAVMWVWLVVFLREDHKTIVETGGKMPWIESRSFLCGHHLPQIPQLHHLVLSVAKHISAIPFAVDICQALCMTHEHASLPTITHTAPVPDLDQGIV